MFNLDGKVAIVTGGASGIGLATAKRLAGAGARVMIADLQDGSEVAQQVGGDYLALDATVQEQFESVINQTREDMGSLDILVNCVGGGTPADILDNIGEEEMLFDFRLNCLPTFYGMQSAARVMQSGSAIINVASVAGLRGTYGMGAYNAAKAAVVNLTRAAALEYGPKGIRINCVCPGVIETPMAAEESVQYVVEAARTACPLGRNGLPEEIAAAIHFLAAEDCGFIIGQAIIVDGGNIAGLSNSVIEALLKSSA